jgi:penicillin amidase
VYDQEREGVMMRATRFGAGRWVLVAAMAALAAPVPGHAAAHDVRILRDEYGVPHVYADDLGALYFGFGHAVAQDRLFQLEMTRRTAWGRVAEVLGPEFLKLDTDQRRVGYTREQVRAQLARLAPEYRTMLKAYADGINEVIASVDAGKARLPVEFNRIGVRPEPWTEDDVAQIFIAFMGTRYSDGAGVVETRDAAWLQEWTRKFGAEKAAVMFDDFIQKEQDPEQITTIPRGEDWRAQAVPSRKAAQAQPAAMPPAETAGASGIVPEGVAAVAALLQEAEARQTEGLKKLGVPRKLGSYGWIVGKSRTLNGSAILMGGPQMGLFSPSYLVEVGLHGAGFDLVGSTPIGHIPVLFGHNASTAWSATAGYGDTVDVFVEKLDPKDPTRYQFKGEWRKLEAREEVFHVKGAADVKETFYRSVHGPIESMDVANGAAYARARGFADLELESMAGWVDKGRAQDWESFVAASRRNALSITWLYADKGGNIGAAFCGRYPVRHPRQDVRLPTPGTGEREWAGFVADEDKPHGRNPKRGTIVNWNNMPAVGWHSPGIFLGRAHRSEQMIEFFESRPVITVEDVKESVRYGAFVDSSAPYFRPRLLDAVSLLAGGDAELKQAAEAIAAWDGMWSDRDKDGKWDAPGLALFDAWYRHLTSAIFSEEKVGSLAKLLQYKKGVASFGLPYGSSVLHNILDGPRSPVRLKGDYLGGAGAEAVMVDALKKAVAELRAEQGPEMAKWGIPIKMEDFDTANYKGVPQGYSELPKYLPMRRATENHIVTLSPAGIRGINVVAPGTSGVPPAPGEPSPHFADQVGLLLRFEYKPMHFHEQDVEANAKSTERLTYAGAAR